MKSCCCFANMEFLSLSRFLCSGLSFLNDIRCAHIPKHNNNNILVSTSELLCEIQPCKFLLLWLSVYTRLPPPLFFKLHSPSWPFPLYPPHLCSVCPHCEKIIPPLQAETVPHLLLNSLRMLSYHLQWKEHREDKRVRGNTVWRMLFMSRHEITCQFGSEREQSNTILITLADVKERLSPWFSSWQCPKNGSGWVSMILYIYLYVCVPEYMHTVSAVAGNKWQVTCRWTLKIK